MKKSLSYILPTLFLLNMGATHALEIDEKLTLRFLKVSSTKKTVLINRGGEDGLVVGDHAKFFITAGVVARGVAEKVSPSRSVWSLYRIVDPAEIIDDKVLNLKIASPVKITDDPTRSLKEEPIPGGTDATVTETSEPGTGAVSAEEQNELKEMGLEDAEERAAVTPKALAKTLKKSTAKNETVVEDAPVVGGTNHSRTWEVWGMLYVNALTGTAETGDETQTETSTSTTASAIDFSFGVEKYFLNTSGFAKELSLSLFVHKKTVESGERIKSEADWFEYGLGGSYHFYNSAASVNKLVGFGTLTFGKGNATIESKSVVNGVDTGEPAEGSNTFFSAGVGAKYALSNGFGIRMILDYYSSSEKYEYENYSDKRKLSGPRINFGLSYRF